MGMAYDLATRSTVLFGGANSGTTYGDTWNWRGGWLQLSPATSPSPRLGAGMAYDGAAGNIVLFGGQSSLIPAGTYLNDTWTWDGTTWTQQFPPVSPPARSAMGMVYDVATKTVLGFGGATVLPSCEATLGSLLWNHDAAAAPVTPYSWCRRMAA
jgi:hypothetical protein